MKYIIGWIIAIAIILFIFFSSNASTKNNSGTSPTNSYDYSDENIESDQAEEDINVDSYQPTFNGYPCTVDCSGHEAGYDWAEEHGITQDDVDSYSGNSNSFMEGMQSYVDEN